MSATKTDSAYRELSDFVTLNRTYAAVQANEDPSSNSHTAPEPQKRCQYGKCYVVEGGEYFVRARRLVLHFSLVDAEVPA